MFYKMAPQWELLKMILIQWSNNNLFLPILSIYFDLQSRVWFQIFFPFYTYIYVETKSTKIHLKEILWLASKWILENTAQEINIKLNNLPCMFNYTNILTKSVYPILDHHTFLVIFVNKYLFDEKHSVFNHSLPLLSNTQNIS